MSVKTYSVRRDGNLQLAPNFRVSEFRSRCGDDTVLIDSRLPELFQRIRDHFGRPVNITSAYRSPAHKAAVGGAQNSQHVLGTAADITINGVTPLEICQFAEWLMPSSGGIGVYQGFSHVDVRASRSRWDQRSGREIVVNGFPGFVPREQDNTESEVEEMIYNYIDENMPEWARPTIQKLVDRGFLRGDENGHLNLNDTMLRIFVVHDRAGMYD